MIRPSFPLIAPLLPGVTYKLELSHSRDCETWTYYAHEFVAEGGETEVFADIDMAGGLYVRFTQLLATSQPYIKTTAKAKPPTP